MTKKIICAVIVVSLLLIAFVSVTIFMVYRLFLNQNNPVNSEYVPNVTFSASIGEVNGQIYSARDKGYADYPEDIPTCKLLPVEVDENHMIGSFCYYDGYVYYTETESGSSDYSTWLYRCKPDWTQKELLDEVICNWEDVNVLNGDVDYQTGKRNFVIDKGVLYYDEYSADGKTTAINLSTMEKYETNMPIYTFACDGITYERSFDSRCDVAIYNDRIFFTDENNNLYTVENENRILLAENAHIDGGCTDEYLYYAEYDGQKSQFVELYRLPLNGGEKELIDKAMTAGGGGPYFCW